MILHVYCDGSYKSNYPNGLNVCGVGAIIKDQYNNMFFENGKVIDTTSRDDYELRALNYGITNLLNLLNNHWNEFRKIDSIYVYNDDYTIIKSINNDNSMIFSKLVDETYRLNFIGAISTIRSKFCKCLIFKYIKSADNLAHDIADSKLEKYIDINLSLYDNFKKDLFNVLVNYRERNESIRKAVLSKEQIDRMAYAIEEIERLYRYISDND